MTFILRFDCFVVLFGDCYFCVFSLGVCVSQFRIRFLLFVCLPCSCAFLFVACVFACFVFLYVLCLFRSLFIFYGLICYIFGGVVLLCVWIKAVCWMCCFCCLMLLFVCSLVCSCVLVFLLFGCSVRILYALICFLCCGFIVVCVLAV